MNIGAMPAPNFKGFIGAFMNQEQYKAARTYIPSPYILADDESRPKVKTNLPEDPTAISDDFGPVTHPLHQTRKAAHEQMVKKVKNLLKDKELEESLKKLFGDRKESIKRAIKEMTKETDDRATEELSKSRMKDIAKEIQAGQKDRDFFQTLKDGVKMYMHSELRDKVEAKTLEQIRRKEEELARAKEEKLAKFREAKARTEAKKASPISRRTRSATEGSSS